jgi:hypothetical protein
MKDENRKAMFAKMGASQPKASTSVPYKPLSEVMKEVGKSDDLSMYDDEKYVKAHDAATQDNIMLENNKRYSYYHDEYAGHDWTAKELFGMNKKQKEIVLANRRNVLVQSNDKITRGDMQGTLTDFGYDRKQKRYFVEVQKVEYPSKIGSTGHTTIRHYYDKSDNEKIFRLHRKYRGSQ